VQRDCSHISRPRSRRRNNNISLLYILLGLYLLLIIIMSNSARTDVKYITRTVEEKKKVAGLVGSNAARGMLVCLCVSVLCCPV
jgi:uncharacterized integral membrane protein